MSDKDSTVWNLYQTWLLHAGTDETLIKELQAMKEDAAAVADAFYRDLEFGTGGLRGIMGPGTNRINQYTVAKASQGVADYVCRHFSKELQKIAIGYDTRNNSFFFAKVAAEVFAANGIKVCLYKESLPTPCLSFAVRALSCAAGIMITASHNSAKYNGYKVYGADGCQITTDAAAEILKEIQKLDIFADVRRTDFTKNLAEGTIQYIAQSVYNKFIEAVKKQSLLTPREAAALDKRIKIIYSPLNGTGLKPVLQVLQETGYTDVTVVKEQALPNGAFPTCPTPNPERKEAMALGIEYAKRENGELVLATDPDCDRVGVAVKNKNGNYVCLTGNEIGILLLDYICARRTAAGTMPVDPVVITTIVTTPMARQIAAHYGVRTVQVLTGFKFIGEQIGHLEALGKEDSYLFGFEESHGYLSGGYVRDKDGVNAVFLICEMLAYYKTRGISLWDKLNDLYRTFGYSLNTLHSFTFEGAAGFDKMQHIMECFRNADALPGPKKVERVLDYGKGIEGLPKSNVLKFFLEGDCSVIIRPSGTEPKLKIYLAISGKSREEAVSVEQQIMDGLAGILCEKGNETLP